MRIKKVTRTIITNAYTVICMNTETAEVSHETYNLSDLLDNEKAVKILRKAHETETHKLVAVESVETFEHLYVMSEEDFMKYATALPPRKLSNK